MHVTGANTEHDGRVPTYCYYFSKYTPALIEAVTSVVQVCLL